MNETSGELIWVAICQDRHLDTDITAWRSRDAAIEHARTYMREHVNYPEMLSENDYGEHWWMRYEAESDYAHVAPAPLS